MKKLAYAFFAVALVAGAGNQTRIFTGTITDTMCGGDHKAMKVNPDSKCVRDCIRMDKTFKYALYDGRKVYTLSDQQTPEQFAGQKVRVEGVLHEKTSIIQVKSIKPAE